MIGISLPELTVPVLEKTVADQLGERLVNLVWPDPRVREDHTNLHPIDPLALDIIALISNAVVDAALYF